MGVPIFLNLCELYSVLQDEEKLKAGRQRENTKKLYESSLAGGVDRMRTEKGQEPLVRKDRKNLGGGDADRKMKDGWEDVVDGFGIFSNLKGPNKLTISLNPRPTQGYSSDHPLSDLDRLLLLGGRCGTGGRDTEVNLDL
jgi:hypothetical protein